MTDAQPLEQVEIASPEPSLDILAVDEALERFEQVDPVKARLVKLRYFIGLTIPEVAEAVGQFSTFTILHMSSGRSCISWLNSANDRIRNQVDRHRRRI